MVTVANPCIAPKSKNSKNIAAMVVAAAANITENARLTLPLDSRVPGYCIIRGNCSTWNRINVEISIGSAEIGGLIAVIGTGVDHQIIIIDEVNGGQSACPGSIQRLADAGSSRTGSPQSLLRPTRHYMPQRGMPDLRGPIPILSKRLICRRQGVREQAPYASGFFVSCSSCSRRDSHIRYGLAGKISSN